MAKLTPQQAANKQARRLKAATEDIRIGVENVTISPTIAAAAKQDKMRAGIINAIDSGKWAAGLKRVTLEDWRSKMLDKGLPRIAAGIDAAIPKTTAFYEELFPFQDTLKKKVDAMPDVTLEDSISKMTEWVRGMANFTRKV